MESAIAGARTCHIIPLELRAAWALGNYKKAQEIFKQAGTAMKPILKNIEHGKDKAISAAPAEQGPESDRIAGYVTTYIAASLYVRLAGQAVSHATQLAATKLAALTGGFLGEIALHSLLSTLSSLVAYGAIGLVVGTSTNLLCEVLLRTYRLQVQLLNWDEVNDWVICEWYGNNAEVAGKQDWEEVQIPRLIPGGGEYKHCLADVPWNFLLIPASYRKRGGPEWLCEERGEGCLLCNIFIPEQWVQDFICLKKNTHYVYSSALRARVRDEEQGISDNVLISIS